MLARAMTTHLGPDARAWLDARGVAPGPLDAALGALLADDAAALPAIARDGTAAIAALHALRDPGTPAHAAASRWLGLVTALAVPRAPQVEHAATPAGVQARPLLDHAVAALGVLDALVRRDVAALAPLPSARIDAAAALIDRLAAAGALPRVRLALLHLDVAKGGTADERQAWAAAGVNLDIHNLGGEDLLRSSGALTRWPLDAADQLAVTTLVAQHGIAGQCVRGEVPPALVPPLDADLADALHVIDLCDTAAVRPGLLDERIAGGLAEVWQHRRGARLPAPALADRLRALRRSRLEHGEPATAVDDALAALAPGERDALQAALATCQLWYCEAATAALSPTAQLKVLAAACGAARRTGVTPGSAWHAQLGPLVARLHGSDARTRYRVRTVEAALAKAQVADLLAGAALPGPLGVFAAALGHDQAVRLDWQASDEAEALVTLLSIYETKSSAAFHSTLKALCDLYGLRKDEFDRVANEADYLATMNAARSDKDRMLDWVVPGRVVEIGPGGGVVLDLLAARFPTSDVLGVDISAEVIAALGARRARDGLRWTVTHADAFALPQLCPPGSVSTVIFCSILHEIYSYVDRGAGRFQLGSVEAIVQAAFATLQVGGRIVIRDGVTPPPGTRRIRLLADDARGLLDLYCAQFEGRRVTYTDLPDGRVEMTAPDAMEFLYTYTWGPASFPYEVREQYGVLPYDAYAASLLAWCGGPGHARLVDIPAAHRSYLQPGYQAGLAGKVELTDEHDRPVPLPDSNCLLVVERTA